MIEEYTLKLFREHYIEHRGIPADLQELVREAFMGGAHTTMLMVANAMGSVDPEPILTAITTELNEFMHIKQAEDEISNATVH